MVRGAAIELFQPRHTSSVRPWHSWQYQEKVILVATPTEIFQHWPRAAAKRRRPTSILIV